MIALAAALLLASGSGALVRLDDGQALAIGRKLWQNECGGKVEELTWWNKGEDFASLGIGHFIWYPKGRRGPFTESFPGALDAIARSGHVLPRWLQGHPPCPWPRRAEFMKDFHSPRMNELRALLAATVPAQARYAADRLEAALPKILAAAPKGERPILKERFRRVAAAPNGVYALMDYVNFKGEGVSPTERYDGLGWGLLQVLELMQDAPPGQPSVESFARAADAALTRRVAHAPKERRARERGWLPGWRARLRTYAEP